MTGIKQSDFNAVTSIDDADNVPLFTAYENKRITYANMRTQLADEIAVRFIYPTTAQLQQSNLEADEDEPNYVRCEETEYRLYKITALAAGVDDIALDNGMTATYQEEYSKSGFVLGAASSMNNALALFDGVTGTQLKTGAVLSTIGGNLASATSIAQVSYPRVDADNAVTMATPTTIKTDLNLPSNTALSISNIEGDIATIEGDIVDINADLDTKVGTVETWAAISTITPNAAGQVFTLKQHTSGGLGGGTLMAFVGSVTDDGGTQKNCLGGFYLKRINYAFVTTEMFGAIGDGVADDTPPCNLLIAYAVANPKSTIVFSDGLNKLTSRLNIDVPTGTTIEFYNSFTTTTTTGVAIQIGTTSTNVFYIDATGGSGLSITRSSIDFSGGSTGLLLANLAFSKIKVRNVRNFGAGVLMTGTQPNGGSSYNDVYIGDLTDNKYNLFLTANGSGYCNENSFHGGSYGFSSAYAGNYAGAFNVYEDSFPSSRLNNNKFWGPSWETADYAVVAYQGYAENTHIYAPRLESANGTGVEFKIVFATGSQCCVLVGGAGVNYGSITDNGTGNMWFSRQGLMINGIGTGSESCFSAKSNVTNTNRVYQGRDTGSVETFYVTGQGDVALTRVKYIGGSAVGTFTLSAGAATVTNSSVTTNSIVRYNLKTVGGTIAALPYVATITPGTGFTLAGGGASNSSTYNYEIVEIG